MTCCWWCCHAFDGKPLGLPYKHDSVRDVFHTMGYYCSWECMKAWNMNSKSVKAPEINMNITMLKKRMFNRVESTRSAPSRYCLKMFGGSIDIEDFRKGLNDCWVHLPNINFYPIVINKYSGILRDVPKDDEEETGISRDRAKIEDINNSESTGGELRLKRPIPLKKNKNNLETLMGLKLRSKE